MNAEKNKLISYSKEEVDTQKNDEIKEESSYQVATIWGFPGGASGKESACNAGDNAGDASSISGPERAPGGGNGTPLQYSCRESPMERGGWEVTVHRLSKSQKRLK